MFSARDESNYTPTEVFMAPTWAELPTREKVLWLTEGIPMPREHCFDLDQVELAVLHGWFVHEDVADLIEEGVITEAAEVLLARYISVTGCSISVAKADVMHDPLLAFALCLPSPKAFVFSLSELSTEIFVMSEVYEEDVWVLNTVKIARNYDSWEELMSNDLNMVCLGLGNYCPIGREIEYASRNQ